MGEGRSRVRERERRSEKSRKREREKGRKGVIECPAAACEPYLRAYAHTRANRRVAADGGARTR